MIFKKMTILLSTLFTAVHLFAVESFNERLPKTVQKSKVGLLGAGKSTQIVPDPRVVSSDKLERPQEGISKGGSKLFRDGSSSGGGNDKVVDPSGNPHLASEFVTVFDSAEVLSHIPASAVTYKMPDNVRNELGKLQRILYSTLVSQKSTERDKQSFAEFNLDRMDFISTEILDAGIQLYLVREIPDGETDSMFLQCANLTRNATIPNGFKRSRSACTLYSTPITVMIDEDFVTPENGSPQLRFQALSLAHEGLRRRGIPDKDISRIDQGLSLALNLLNEQLSGKYREVTPEEQDKLQWLMRLSYQYSLASNRQERFPSWLKQVKVAKNGGGYYRLGENMNIPSQMRPYIADTAFIGIAATVIESKVPDQVILVDTNICQQQGCVLGEGSRIVSSQVNILETERGAMLFQPSARVGANASLRNIYCNNVKTFDVQADAKVNKFYLNLGAVSIGEAATINDVEIIYNDHDFNFKNPRVGFYMRKYFELQLEQNSSIESLRLHTGVPLRLGPFSRLYGSEPSKLWIFQAPRSFLKKESDVGLTISNGSQIELSEKFQDCQQVNGQNAIQVFSESIKSLPDIKKLCLKMN